MAQPVDLPELLYIQDPLCGWCYGMSPVIQQVQEVFADRVTVSVLSGGMVTGERVGPIRNMWGYIGQALGQVEQATGVVFGEAFRQLGEAGTDIQDSEVPSRAITVFRQLDQEGRAVDFAHEVQLALFRDGKSLNDLATYDPLVAAYGLDVAEFRRRMASADAASATQQEFAAVNRIGVRGFPTTVLRVGAQGYLLARGFQPYPEFSRSLTQALEQAAEEQGAGKQ